MTASGTTQGVGIAVDAGSVSTSEPAPMRTILLANLKGGCGKTTIAFHLAVAADGAGYRVTAIDTDRQGDLYRHLTHSPERALDRPPVRYGNRSSVMYAPGGGASGATASGVDLVIVDTAPAASVPSILDVVIVPIDGPNAALNANEIVSDALDRGARRVVLVKNGIKAGGKDFAKEFYELGIGAPAGVVVCPVELPFGPCIKRTSHTNRPAWSDPYQGPDAKAMHRLCSWTLRETLPPLAKHRGAA
jgi:CobQ/CobB/MinD/ParA family nucleotide binding protein